MNRILSMAAFFLVFIWSVNAFGGTIEENLKKLVAEKTRQSVDIESVQPLNGDKSVFVALLRDKKSGNLIPIVTNQEGNQLFVLTDMFFSQNDADARLVRNILHQAQEENNKNMSQDAIVELLKSIPDDYLIKIPSYSKDAKTITFIISDPMCPHCQEELRHINKRLKDSDVYMVEVAFLGVQSKYKASEILSRINKLKTAKEKIDLLNQVYATSYTSNSSDLKENQKVENITKKIADSGLIRGVPFVYEVKK